MQEFKFERIQIGDSTGFNLDANSPAYQFDTGKSFFKAFVLPEWSFPYHLSIRSYMLGDHIDSAYILYPQIVTLNDDYGVVRSTDPRVFRLKKAGFTETAKQTWGLMYKLEGHISFTDENKTERYLIVLTTDELLKARTSTSTWRTVPIIFPGIVGVIPIGKYEVLVPHSPVGRISISLFGQDQQGSP
jgi:maltose operon protein